MNNKLILVPIATICLLITTAVNPHAPFVEGNQTVQAKTISSSQSSTGDLPSLANLLRPDGSLDLTTGFTGSLDPTGYSMSYAPDGSPRFQDRASLSSAGSWKH